MSWSAPVDLYCERTDAAFWSEPVNALTNAAFLVAAAVAFVHYRRRGARDPAMLALILLAAAIGVGSFLFHTLATEASAWLDIGPIAAFVGLFAFLGLRFAGLGRAPAIAIVGATGAVSATGIALLPAGTVNGSLPYIPPLLVIGWLGLARRRSPRGRQTLAAAAVFLASLGFRLADEAACAATGIGTHFMWHLLNATAVYLALRACLIHRTGDRVAARGS